MCGICGAVSFQPNSPIDRSTLLKMNSSLYHRGPDDEGYYADDQVGLAMRRLSIIDLRSGQQPISNELGNIWAVYNGEIYNFQEVRAALEQRGHTFKTQTDTEVILHAYEEYGDQCVTHFNGMFAIALWDAREHRLFLARDRLGIKPLYYWSDSEKLVFGSELKALLLHPDVPRLVDLAALDLFLTLEYIPAPRTIYKGISKLLPGHHLVVENRELKVTQYWDVPYNPIHQSEAECGEILSGLIKESVRLHLISDVPLGAFLSGGIDSSTIVGFMSQSANVPAQTFSIGFEDNTYNELPYANAVAKYFGTKHHFEVLKSDHADLMEQLVAHFDEPFADTSIFPTFLVSKLASRHVKVVLSGDGGDELFGGYDTYLADKLDQYYARLPRLFRQQVFPNVAEWLLPQPAKKGWINKVKRMVEGGSFDPSFQHARWMMFLNSSQKNSLYRSDLQTILDHQYTSDFFSDYFEKANSFDRLAQQQYVDVKSYLADDILTKVDRMSMAVSIEARVPLLDYRIVEFALNLPTRMKLNGTRTKSILRQAVKNLVPQFVLEKPKEGFSIPMKRWLCTSLKPMMLDLLSNDSLQKHDYFDRQVVARWIREHLDGRVNHSHRLWALMVFEMWRQNEKTSAYGLHS
ncbi:MAG TPA: asparagine synthase (glutamine-hydrolyzing) [Anaerolineales bacterium]|nr:asparagine synthase (glutamine-hydrolyzing) [Anaerolineales bacterium]